MYKGKMAFIFSAGNLGSSVSADYVGASYTNLVFPSMICPAFPKKSLELKKVSAVRSVL